MPKYINYRYIFPPRPKNAISPDDLNFWDNGSLICQPKLNGSNCLIFTNGQKIMVMNRHNQRLTNFQLSDAEVKNLYRGNGGWMILNGEYLNKSKSDETGQVFNHKFVIFDILCYDGDYLVGKTFEERVNLLDTLYDCIESEKDYLYSISTNVYRVKSYRDGFKSFFDEYTPIDMIEGVVLKRANARLELGATEQNNIKSQLKSRKPTKNYKY
jgi:ATP-dependent DNA ligase